MQKLTKLISEINFLLLPTAVSITLLILILSLVRTESMPKIEVQQADKYFHAIAYFVLNAAWIITFRFKFNYKKRKTYVLLLFSILLFGIIIEFLQKTITTYRSFDVYDILANSIGASIFFIVYFISKRIYRRFDDKK